MSVDCLTFQGLTNVVRKQLNRNALFSLILTSCYKVPQANQSFALPNYGKKPKPNPLATFR